MHLSRSNRAALQHVFFNVPAIITVGVVIGLIVVWSDEIKESQVQTKFQRLIKHDPMTEFVIQTSYLMEVINSMSQFCELIDLEIFVQSLYPQMRVGANENILALYLARSDHQTFKLHREDPQTPYLKSQHRVYVNESFQYRYSRIHNTDDHIVQESAPVVIPYDPLEQPWYQRAMAKPIGEADVYGPLFEDPVSSESPDPYLVVEVSRYFPPRMPMGIGYVAKMKIKADTLSGEGILAKLDHDEKTAHFVVYTETGVVLGSSLAPVRQMVDITDMENFGQFDREELLHGGEAHSCESDGYIMHVNQYQHGWRSAVAIAKDRLIDSNRSYIFVTSFAALSAFFLFLHAVFSVRTTMRLQRDWAAQDADRRDFTAFMCHELRNPLHGVMATAKHLLDVAQDKSEEELAALQEEVVEAMEVLCEASLSMRVILDDVLDLSKVEADRLQLESIPLSPLRIAAIVQRLQHSAAEAKNVNLSIKNRSTITSMLGDPLRIQQILSNLITNAIKFTPHGKNVALEIFDGSDSPDSDWIRFAVADEGIGITKAELPLLFQSYTQAKVDMARRHGGTGLGLAICNKLARKMGGKITVQSTVGTGSRFTLQLPVHQPERTASPMDVSTLDPTEICLALPSLVPVADAAILSAADAQGGKEEDIEYSDAAMQDRPSGVMEWPKLAADQVPAKLEIEEEPPRTRSTRVLLVDDILVNRKIGARILQSLGCVVDTAENGQEAVTRASETEYSVIFLDINMPVMGGLEAAKEMRRIGISVPIIAVTGNVMEEDQHKFTECGMNGFLPKPFTPAELKRSLDSVMSQVPPRCPLSP